MVDVLYVIAHPGEILAAQKVGDTEEWLARYSQEAILEVAW